ncbi:MAG: PEP/pyruvate-binding domain-containing protein [Eggerthellaceae bacterium]
MTADVKRVYAFGKDADGNNVTEGNKDMKYILGGKGANLAEMAVIGLPVPPGFTITCQTCMEYANADNTWPEGALDEIEHYRLDLERRIGKKIGDAEDPLLVSVRGCALCPWGMMDTVLNLGLNDQSINGLIKHTDNPRFSWDSYRRFIQMFSNVVMGLDGDLFENAINAKKIVRGVKAMRTHRRTCRSSSRNSRQSSENVSAEESPCRRRQGELPQNPDTQLRLAIEAVFGSWNNPRATLYRKQNKIADDVAPHNVQCMVFGNKGETSPALRSRATLQMARRNSTATTWSMPRVKTSSRHSQHPAPSQAQACRRVAEGRRRARGGLRTSRITIATCAISSSPSSRASSGCCRLAWASVPPPLLCILRSRWSKRAL